MALAAERGEKGRRPSIQKKGPWHEDITPLPYVPQELLSDILLRLPVKSLLKFRCVNKFWASLIFSAEFIKLHRNMNKRYERHQLMLYNRYGRPISIYICSLPSVVFENHPFLNCIKLEIPFPRHAKPVLDRIGKETQILASNGLVCVLSRALFATPILWNPWTRKSRALPKAGDRVVPNTQAFGFGYDEVNDVYKLAGFFFPKDYQSSADLVVEVYNSKSNSWKGTKGYLSYFISSDSDVLVKGSLHWPNPNVIVSFNLARETFGKVTLPNYEGHPSYRILGTLEDCLSLSCGYPCDRTDVWVMKEYGVESSWTKLLSVNFVSRFRSAFISQKDKILICTYNKIVLYNSKNNPVNKFMVGQLPEDGEGPDIVPIVESLALI